MAGTRTHTTLEEAKDLACVARVESSVSYKEVARAIGIGDMRAYALFDRREPHRHLRYGDILAMSRDTQTAVRVFVHALVEHITAELARWTPQKTKKKKHPTVAR
jgi:hypothetical protein